MVESGACESADCLTDILTAQRLNQGCACRFLDWEHLQHQLEADPALAGLGADILQTRPNLFSSSTVFITPAQRESMLAMVRAVEFVIESPAWETHLGSDVPEIARLNHGPRGAFLGFDFHLGDQGPQLIEINTNAGGFLLNAVLARAQTACCAEVKAQQFPATDLSRLDERVLAMFQSEWQLQRGGGRPGCVAIVDDSPRQQYLYPEFLLFQQFFARDGIHALIADPRDLRWDAGQLWCGEYVVDLIYNRLTDFYLTEPAHAAMRAAYMAGAVVVTPHPRAHARYADKRHLAALSDPAVLDELGVPDAVRSLLQQGVPPTECVTPERAECLWAERKKLFFKPVHGFGSRAAYRGDKLTRRVWQEILAGDYVAQALVPPSGRLIALDNATCELKLDVRAYAYCGEVQLFASRLYAGQTTNFRTPGGGFASVFVLPTPSCDAACIR